MDDFWDVEDMEELFAERVDAVLNPASGLRFLVMKAEHPAGWTPSEEQTLAKAVRTLGREDPVRLKAVHGQVRKMQRILADELAERRRPRNEDPVTKAVRKAVDQWRAPQPPQRRRS